MEQNLFGTGKGQEYTVISETDREKEFTEMSETDREREFTEIYERYVDDIYRLCFSFLKNPMDAEDAVQETFLRYYHSEKSFDTREHIKAWLIVTASNYCKDLLKQWWRRRQNLEDFQGTVGEEIQMVDEMMELVMQLPDKYKTAVYLYYYEGYDSGEIARLLHKPSSTIRTYLQKARKLLKQELERGK